MNFKEQYKETPWWRFKRRNYLYSMWQSALDLMIKNSNECTVKAYAKIEKP